MGIIFDIQKFCLHDGPGIRTTVFLKGCNIRCLWCHNPESFQKQPELSYTASNCIGCERCTTVCPVHAHSFDENGHHIDRSLCTACGTCVQECLTNALKIFGMERSVQDILSEVVKDRPYFEQSGGGITISAENLLRSTIFCLSFSPKQRKKICTSVWKPMASLHRHDFGSLPVMWICSCWTIKLLVLDSTGG